MSSIPSPQDSPKLCECGCGLPAPIARQAYTHRGFIKGQPRRFIKGHHVRRPLAPRFWAKVDTSGGPDACWPWLAVKGEGGYGRIRWQGHMIQAPRITWYLTRGPIPDGMLVCHRCDNPPCCNPAHLFLGTQADNVADRQAKGRAMRGETHYRAQLTEDQVCEIRERFAVGGTTKAELARQYNVTRTLISNIVLRRTWKHLL